MMDNNANVVKQAYEAFGRGDIASLLTLLDDKVTWSTPKTLPQGGEFRGKAGVGKFFEGVGAAWSNLSLDIEAVGEVGEGIVVGIVRGDGMLTRGSASGYGAVHVFTVVNGKITRFREYTNLDGSIS